LVWYVIFNKEDACFLVSVSSEYFTQDTSRGGYIKLERVQQANIINSRSAR